MHYYRAIDDSSPSLQHFKYVRRYKKNGKWRYIYPTPKILDTSDYDNLLNNYNSKKSSVKKKLDSIKNNNQKNKNANKNTNKLLTKAFQKNGYTGNKNYSKTYDSILKIQEASTKEKKSAAVKDYLETSHEFIRSYPSGSPSSSFNDTIKKKTKNALSKFGIDFKD